jgi:EmrB/QacA subfamily drug resistance transporter
MGCRQVVGAKLPRRLPTGTFQYLMQHKPDRANHYCAPKSANPAMTGDKISAAEAGAEELAESGLAPVGIAGVDIVAIAPDAGAASAGDQPLPGRWVLTDAEIRPIILGVCTAMFIAALNQTIIATALPTIGRDFHDFDSLSWLITAYLLSSTIAGPLCGKLSDIYGRRHVMMLALGMFVIGSIACALAPNMLILILMRGLQGIGGGGIVPLVQATVADAVAPRERGRYQAYIGTVWVAAGIAGPVMGGYIADHLHWSWVFWVNVPLGLGAAWIINRQLKRLPVNHRKHKLDLFGAFLMMSAAISLLLALTWGGVRYPWLSWTIILLVVFSFVFTMAFAYRIAHESEPFLPLSILANPVVRCGTAASSCAVSVGIGLTVFMPLYYESVHHLSASDSGFALIPIAVMSTPGSILSGRVMLHFDRYKWLPMIGLSSAALALGCLAIWPAANLWIVSSLLCVFGVGIGTVFSLATVSIQNAVSRFQVGTATGVMNFFRALTSALVVAIMGAIIFTSLGRDGKPVDVLSAMAASGTDLAGIFRWVFVASICFLLLSIFSLVMMEERPLRGRNGEGKAG